MRRVIAVFICLVLAAGIFPSAFAQEIISKSDNGKIIRIDAENGLSYCTDFYKVSVSALRREGDSLFIEFDLGHIELTNFYSHGRDARILSFSDGMSVSGKDFNESGEYTGNYSGGAEVLKANQEARIETAENPQANIDYMVRIDYTGINVFQDDMPVYGEQKKLCAAKLRELCGDENEYRQAGSVVSLYLKENADMSLTAVKEIVETADGYILSCPLPECVLIKSGAEICPLSEGNTSVTFANSLGMRVAHMPVKVSAGGEGLVLSCPCPCCGDETGGSLHLLPCGHYFCMEAYTPEEHGTAPCGAAGHCISSETDHGICSNCKGALCGGKQHGMGYCEHRHDWYIINFAYATQTTDGFSTSKCMNCGAEYTEVIKAYGAKP